MKTYIVDSFTDKPFAGNPAGVCLVEKCLDAETMLNIAQELGLSETAFVSQNDDGYSIRFFSPVMEIPLCGHATLASARVMFDENGYSSITFRNVQGLDLVATANGNEIILKFPLYDTVPADVPDALFEALGLTAVKNVAYNQETNILLLEIAATKTLASLEPNFAALLQSHDGINGVLVTAPSHDDGYDFHSRYFWPWSGTNEDPATGGTHTFLTKYWGDRLGKTRMRSFQSSKRSGFMAVEILDGELLITSQACTVLRGELAL